MPNLLAGLNVGLCEFYLVDKPPFKSLVKILGQVVDVVKCFKEGTLNEVFNDLMHKHLISDHELWAMRIRTMYAKGLEVA